MPIAAKPRYAGSCDTSKVNTSCEIAVGKLATIPAKMMSETPLPTPYSEMSSPIHIRSIEPAAMTQTLVKNPIGASAGTMPFCCRRSRNANA